MRKALLLFAVLSFAGSLWAADPLIGTWKLNIEKSKFPPNHPAIPKEQIQTYRELSNDRIEMTYQNVSMDGSSDLIVSAYPIQGGIGKIQKGDTPFSFVQTRIAPDEWIVTALREGKQVWTRQMKISEDGKSMRVTARSFYRDGKPFELLEVYEKQ